MVLSDLARIVAPTLVTALALCATQAGAQDYPTKPIRTRGGFVAGGGTDLMKPWVGLHVGYIYSAHVQGSLTR